MPYIIRECIKKEATRSTFPDISNEFIKIANWNTYTRDSIVKSDNGTKYKHMGTFNNAIIVEKLKD